LNASDLNKAKEVVGSIKESIKNFFESNKNVKAESKVNELQNEIQLLLDRKIQAEGDNNKKSQELEMLLNSYDSLQKEIEKEKDSSRDAEKSMFRIVALQNEVRGELSMIRVREDKLKLEKTDFERELQEAAVLIGRDAYLFETYEGGLSFEERHVQEERRKQIEKIQIRLEDQGGVSPTDVMKEFKETTERDEFLAKELVDLENSANSLNNLIKELTEKLDVLFAQGIEKINKQFKELFTLMFGGGEASLTVVR